MKGYKLLLFLLFVWNHQLSYCQLVIPDVFKENVSTYCFDKVFDGNGQVFSISDSSTIIFKNAGRIISSIIVGNGVTVIASPDIIIFDNVTLKGTWQADVAYSTWFGFKADCLLNKQGVFITGSDNSAKFRNLLLFRNIEIVKGNYYFANPGFIVNSGTVINGNGAILKWINPNDNTQFLRIGESNYVDFKGWQTDSVSLNYFTIIGGKIESDVKTEACHGISIKNGAHITINKVNSNLNRGDGLYIGNAHNDYNDDCIPSDIVITNCVFDANHRQGSSIVRGNNIEYHDCVFSNTIGTPLEYGVDIEPSNASKISKVNNVKFNRCNFSGNNKGGLMIRSTPNNGNDINVTNITVENCVFNNNWIFIRRIEDLIVSGCSIYSNSIGVNFNPDLSKNVMIKDCILKGDNGSVGIFVRAYPGGQRQGLTIENCVISGFYVGISISKLNTMNVAPVWGLNLHSNVVQNNKIGMEVAK